MKQKRIIMGILLIFGAAFCVYPAAKTGTNLASDFTVTANGSPEGIYLYINNIPKDAYYLSVSMYDITAKDQLYTGTGFQGNELEQLRKTGYMICPFVKTGHEYEITVTSLKMAEESIETINFSVITAVAKGGVHLINNPTLVWNNSSNIATLSAKPIFSKDEFNSQNMGFLYGLVFQGEEMGGKVSENQEGLTNSLAFDNTQNHNSIVEMMGSIGVNGDIPMYADVGLTLEYEKTKWTIIFAKSEGFILSL